MGLGARRPSDAHRYINPHAVVCSNLLHAAGSFNHHPLLSLGHGQERPMGFGVRRPHDTHSYATLPRRCLL